MPDPTPPDNAIGIHIESPHDIMRFERFCKTLRESDATHDAKCVAKGDDGDEDDDDVVIPLYRDEKNDDDGEGTEDNEED